MKLGEVITCKDCVNYDNCKRKDEYVSIGTKIKELSANEFKCFELKYVEDEE